MYTYPISFTGVNSIHFRIAKKYKNNTKNDLLYNDVSKVVSELKLPASFENDKIDIIFEDNQLQQNVIKNFTQKLKEKAIQFKILI